MWLRHPKGRMQVLLASAAAVLILGPGIAGAGAGTGGDSNDEAQLVADAMRVQHNIIVAYNDKKWDEVGALYGPEAIMLPPNHEPVRGPAAIVEYLKGVRDAAGPVDGGVEESVRVSAGGKVASLVGKFTIQSGRIRMMGNEVYERQPDGSVLSGVDEFSFRDATG